MFTQLYSSRYDTMRTPIQNATITPSAWSVGAALICGHSTSGVRGSWRELLDNKAGTQWNPRFPECNDWAESIVVVVVSTGHAMSGITTGG